MQHYLYKGVEYKSEREVRNAIFEHERKAFGNPKNEADWNVLGVSVREKMETASPEPQEPDFAELKQMKLGSLESEFNEYRNSSKTFFVSSLGFKVNANVTAFNNISGLVSQLRYKADKGEENPRVGFMTFDDELIMLTLDEMKILQVEISENGSKIYSQKWAVRQAIKNAKNKADLETVNIEFTHTDFTI